ncbi:MAG: LppX_LprAFG lipoprotein [Ornithinimicrobium sp.]|uniref:LppX_LprAFG lipoprotein n=1 Tax=Ornithinimicrobium sp. TaxID=1977084 RepID=UPI0026DF446F|nr:LppX_LprAFG lipoprotein [Ornithinimicrobium sp.]MDO5739708.1 LppX_LprAFG lipoprotein [Ornithinimicrobium sp.]
MTSLTARHTCREGTPRRRAATPRAALAVVLGLTLALAGCSDEEADVVATSSAPPPTAADRLEQAEGVLVDAGTLHLSMTGTQLPEDTNSYIISAVGDGTMEPPAFTGTITAKIAGIQADIPTVALDGDLWVKLPYVPKHVKTDPATLGVPDPATLFDPESGLVGLLTQTQTPAFGERARAGSEIVQEITGTLPGKAVTDLLYVGDAASPFDVTYGLVEESWQVRTVTITGPFYPPATSTYTLVLDAYGAPVTVTQP